MEKSAGKRRRAVGSLLSLFSTLSPRLRLFVGATFMLGAITCQSTEHPPTLPPKTLSIIVSPASTRADGSVVLLTVRALDAATNTPGEGSVAVSVRRGTLDNGGTSATSQLVKGEAKFSYACDAELDPACVGTQVISAEWNGSTERSSVEFMGQKPDAGVGGAGAGGGAATGGAGGSIGGAGGAGGEKPGLPQQISYLSTTCSGNPCTLMGVKGSGYNEQAAVQFKVTDEIGQPVPNVPVHFSIVQAPSGASVLTPSTTDLRGIAATTVASGIGIGAFAVHATVIAGEVETNSPTIGISGAKPANEALSLTCSPENLGAFAANQPPRDLNATCKVRVIDRYSNPVGTGTPVNFKVEAGSVPASVNTKAYDPKAPNESDVGTATFTFNTLGNFPPVDVEPLVDEPRSGTKNPRDGLVTIIAYTTGEESFKDDNGDGLHQDTETFMDQGEPFVDANDNGVWDPGEFFIDIAPQDEAYSGPNAKWDSSTTIWIERRFVYSGVASPATIHSYLTPESSPSSEFFVGKGQVGVAFDAYFRDERFNVTHAEATTVTAVRQAGVSRGSFNWVPVKPADGFGYKIDRRLVDPTGARACVFGQMPRCVWKIFFDFKDAYGRAGKGEWAGATDAERSQHDTVTVTSSVFGGGSIGLNSYAFIE